MSLNFHEKQSLQSKKMITAYFLVFLAIFGFAAYSARTVIFRPWTVREWVSAISIGQKIFVFGGRSTNVKLHDDVLQIDIKHNTLKRIAKLPSKGFAINSVYVNDRIYLIGGYNGKQYIDDILEFHPSTKKTRVIGKLPEPRAFGGAAAILGKIYYIGGWKGKTYATEILQIDPNTGDVSVVGHLPGPRENFPAVSLSDRLYIIGGEDDQGKNLDDIVEIDPLQGIIQRTAKLPSPRTRPSATVLGNKIYVVGGWRGKHLDEIIEIDPSGEEIEVRVIGRRPELRSDMGFTAIDPYLYLIGGVGEPSGRQIGVLRIDPKTSETMYIRLKSYVWW
jgi:hypothetical protein